ncbi:Fad binding domain-containing protein [Mycena venus]|uniref:Fad binding domain-containing protein n=1 Tax=Mycena venus TaxID=2733690 RepID=A0A8H6Y4A6_9AGAR|nr:Fad binding domain-containing protein [Mycena venus]
MFSTRVWLLSASFWFLCSRANGETLADDNAQVVFGTDEPTGESIIMEELSDLLQSSIWFEENRTDASEVARHCVCAKKTALCPIELTLLSQCNILNSTLPGQVFFSESAEYQAQQASYYSLEQTDLYPACRVSPSSAIDVSAIITLATQYDCAFAVRSGGHILGKGYSNIDATGFTIDLQKMNEISLLEEGKIVSFGSGCRWHHVYAALKPHNLTTVGGRVPDVGVAGFLLGGGISALSLAHGFGSSNIVNYQVVLADGTIRDVNEQTLSDLYWALKLGSTNFAVVTRFDMTTYPLSDVWGGSLVFEISKGPALLQSHVDFTAKLSSDPMGLNVIGLAWEPVQQNYIVWSPNLYLLPNPSPPLYADFQELMPEALLNTMRIADLMSITEEFQAMAPGAGRVQWFTLTLKADAAVLWDIHRKGVEIFQPYLNRTGFTWAALFQPLNHGFAAASEKNGGNPSGIKPEDGDSIGACSYICNPGHTMTNVNVTPNVYLVVLGMAQWSDRVDDEILKEKVHEHWKWSENTAHERGLLHPFIYMNYASSLQDVMGSIGPENLARMRTIKDRYDPANRFGMNWKGGFKL